MANLVSKQEMESKMRSIVQHTLPAMTTLYRQAENFKKADNKEEWDNLIINDVEPLMRELSCVRTAAEHCLDLHKRPFVSEALVVFNTIISEEIQQQEDRELAEIALIWGRKVYSILAMRKEIKTYV